VPPGGSIDPGRIANRPGQISARGELHEADRAARQAAHGDAPSCAATSLEQYPLTWNHLNRMMFQTSHILAEFISDRRSRGASRLDRRLI
jgi:hypothetical protein